MHKKLCISMTLLKRLCQGSKTVIPVQNHFTLRLHTIPIVVLAQRQRRQVDRRHREEEEVARPGLVHLVQQPGVARENGVVKSGVVEPPAIPHVVDPNEKGEQTILSGPRRVGRMRTIPRQELALDLVDERQHCGSVRRHELGVHGCAAVGEVVRLDK